MWTFSGGYVRGKQILCTNTVYLLLLKMPVVHKNSNLSDFMLLTITTFWLQPFNVIWSQLVNVYAYIIVHLFFKSCFSRFYPSSTSYLWTENAVALIGQKGLSKYHCTIRKLAVLPFFTTLAWDFTVTVHKLQNTSAGKTYIIICRCKPVQ